MNFIAILVCIVLQRFLNFDNSFNEKWFNKYLHWLNFLIEKKNNWIALAIIIIPVFVILDIAQLFLANRLFGLFYLILSCAILFFCIDARDFRRQLTQYFETQEKHDESAAKKIAAKYSAIDNTYSIQEVNRAVTKAILLKSFEKLFSGLFWFAIFGIYGVTFYFALSLLGKKVEVKQEHTLQELTKLALQIHQIADWLPARILGLTFAIGGQIKKGFSYCVHNFKNNYKYNDKFVIESGLIALDAKIQDAAKLQDKENQNALNLVDRALIIWIIFIGLISLAIMF